MDTIKGYIQEQPEMRFIPSGVAVTNMYLSDDKADENSRKYRIIVWEELAEIANQFLYPDDFIYVKGYWKTREWEGPGKQQHSITELVAKQIWIVREGNQFTDIMELPKGGK